MNSVTIFQAITKQKLILPFYHAVAEQPLPHIKHLYHMKTVKEFLKDLDFLLQHFEPIGAETLYQFHVNKTVPQKPVFHLTFDDGLKEISEIVAPILLQKGVPATFFVNSGFVDNKALFYRYHESLAIEDLSQKDKLTNSLKTDILSCSYKNRNDLFQYFSQLQIDDFLKTDKPYLTVEQLKQLRAQGFTIGAHSVDHPYYEEISLEEQHRQTLSSLEFISSLMHQKLRLFAFPFTDNNVSRKFFNNIEPFVDLSFGTANFKKEEVPFHYQRIAAEKKTMDSLESIVMKAYFMKGIRYFLGKDTIYRIM